MGTASTPDAQKLLATAAAKAELAKHGPGGGRSALHSVGEQALKRSGPRDFPQTATRPTLVDPAEMAAEDWPWSKDCGGTKLVQVGSQGEGGAALMGGCPGCASCDQPPALREPLVQMDHAFIGHRGREGEACFRCGRVEALHPGDEEPSPQLATRECATCNLLPEAHPRRVACEAGTPDAHTQYPAAVHPALVTEGRLPSETAAPGHTGASRPPPVDPLPKRYPSCSRCGSKDHDAELCTTAPFDVDGDVAKSLRAAVLDASRALPKCTHGHNVLDWGGERLAPPCGCRWQLPRREVAPSFPGARRVAQMGGPNEVSPERYGGREELGSANQAAQEASAREWDRDGLPKGTSGAPMPPVRPAKPEPLLCPVCAQTPCMTPVGCAEQARYDAQEAEATSGPLLEPPTSWHHAGAGLWFCRATNGGVHLVRAPIGEEPNVCDHPTLTMPASAWASVVAHVSFRGDTGQAHQAALLLHGEAAARPD